MKRIVIVEDDIWLREELRDIYRKQGYDAVSIESFEDTVRDIKNAAPDLVLLDLNLPGATGFEICRELKKEASAPVLVLTSRDQMADELHALELGADDYLTKPCHKDRLLARTQNLLIRYEGSRFLLNGQGFLLDRQNYTLFKDGESVILPENTGKILEILMLHPEETVTKEMLCQGLWGTIKYIDENALQVNMTRLRKVLKTLGLEHRIETIRGVGYRFWREHLE